MFTYRKTSSHLPSHVEGQRLLNLTSQIVLVIHYNSFTFAHIENNHYTDLLILNVRCWWIQLFNVCGFEDYIINKSTDMILSVCSRAGQRLLKLFTWHPSYPNHRGADDIERPLPTTPDSLSINTSVYCMVSKISIFLTSQWQCFTGVKTHMTERRWA